MNLFSILASGNRLLKEEHVSATLGWLLDPSQDHGLGYEFVWRVLKAVFPSSPLEKELDSNCGYRGLTIRDRTRLTIGVELEKEVKAGNHNRSIDIVLNVAESYLVAIENKINVIATQQGQIKEEALGLLNHENTMDKQVYLIYLVPGKGLAKANEELQELPTQVHANVLAWEGENSMVSIIQNVLKEESCGLIDPIPSECVFILKSLSRFAENKFTYPIRAIAIDERGGDYEIMYRGYIELKNAGKDGYVGYQGGLTVLRNDIVEANDDLVKRERLLNNRPYKWVSQLANHTRNNWIPYLEFIKEFEPII